MVVGSVPRAQGLRYSPLPLERGVGVVPATGTSLLRVARRMTIGHLIECITGKVAILKGEVADGTPFSSDESRMVKHMEELASALHAHGYELTETQGEEVMYSGVTGARLTGRIFIGPTYYRRLKHMVQDKLSARPAEGPVQAWTRQPANHGRKNGTKYTSTRFGNMEGDCFIGHGVDQSIRERFLYSSDYYQTDICNRCGTFNAGSSCRCEAGSTSTEMPYVFKLFSHNISGLMVKTSIRTENSESMEVVEEDE